METTVTAFTLFELFQMGGIIMWPLLIFSIAAVAIIVERAIFLTYHNLALGDLKPSVEKAIMEGVPEKARNYLETLTKRHMGARVLLTLVRRHELSEHRMEKAVEAEAMNCVSALENGLRFLTVLGSLAPLTGFLGTVTGMIGAFRAIAEATEVNAQIVASGIYEALITTVFGLVIAIIAMSAYSIFTHKVDRFSSEVEIVCSDLIIMIHENRKETPEIKAAAHET